MADTTEKAIDTAANIVGEVAEHTEEVEKFVRSLTKLKVGYYALGLIMGAAAGAAVAYKVAYARANTKYSKIAEDEIAEIREHYHERSRALEEKAAKRPLAELIEESGYSGGSAEDDEKEEGPPMAVQPPEGTTARYSEREQAAIDEVNRQYPGEEVVETRNVFEKVEPEYEWDMQAELKKRSPDIPYVIHYDEIAEMDGYDHMMLTYYTHDDVLANDRDEVQDPDERTNFIGVKTLERFGHGSRDPSIVFVRNDRLEIVFEIVKSDASYVEVVHGFSHDQGYEKNLKRMRTWDDEAD